MYPNQPTPWNILSFTYAYANDQIAAQAVADLTASKVCRHSAVVRPAGVDAVPDSVFLHGRSGFYEDGSWMVFTRVGSHVMTFEAQAMTNPPTGGPGDDFLVGIALAAHRTMTGQSPGTIPLPLPQPRPTTGPAPTGLPAPSELGDGWQIGSDPGDQGTVSTATVPGTGCTGVGVAVATSGCSVTYRGHQPLGDQEWLLTESLVTLTPAGRTEALARLASAGTACDRTKTLLSGTSVAGDYAYAERAVADAGSATMYTVAGDQLIVLSTLPGGAMGQDVPLPGDTQWLTDTARLAVRRATAG